MLRTTLEVLDSSVINVTLPHLQGSCSASAFSASLDEIAWVLTSYPVANEIERFMRCRWFDEKEAWASGGIGHPPNIQNTGPLFL